MNTRGKENYVPPTWEIKQVVLESSIAVHSPVKNVDLRNWNSEDYEDDVSNNYDIWLDL